VLLACGLALAQEADTHTNTQGASGESERSMVKSEGLIRRVTTIAAGLLLAALLAVLVLLWGERPAEAAFPGANGKIVFAGRVMRTTYKGQDEIFKMNPDGSNATRLTHNTGHDYDPAWSSDGQKIAFTRKEGIVTFDLIHLARPARGTGYRLGRFPCLDYCQISVKRAGGIMPALLTPSRLCCKTCDKEERARQDSNLRPSDS
jgi:hypothetical protein